MNKNVLEKSAKKSFDKKSAIARIKPSNGFGAELSDEALDKVSGGIIGSAGGGAGAGKLYSFFK